MSELEARTYYAGLPSYPVLVARSSKTLWKAPSGPGSWTVMRKLCPVGNHALKEVWEDNLALKIHAILDSMKVNWTSTDVVRIGYDQEESPGPVILWIGVVPESLSSYDGILVTFRCRMILEEYDITDVEVEIRESNVTRSAGPKLLRPTRFRSLEPTAEAREPLSTTLGLPISALSTPWAEGTGGFFITEGGRPERLLLVTTRHAVFTPDKDKNEHFEYRDDDQCRYDVTLFGDAGFNKHVESIQDEIREKEYLADRQERRIEAAEERRSEAAKGGRVEEAEEEDYLAVDKRRNELDEIREAREKLNDFYEEVSTQWATRESRILGHVILSPPISVGIGSESYTEDWALIEIDASKVDASNFKGNTIDLTGVGAGEFIRNVYPNYSPWGSDPLPYPIDDLLRLKGTIPDDEMRKPTVLDQHGDPCLIVIKRGSATGLTMGRANGIYSYVRNCSDDGDAKISKEWAILSFSSKPSDRKRSFFSEEGDSGSVIVDGGGRIGGLLTGGAGTPSSPDLTYATPINFLLKRMQEKGIYEPNIDPVLTT